MNCEHTDNLDYADVLKAVPGAVLVTDKAGCIVLMSRAAEIMLGRPMAECKEKPIRQIVSLIDAGTRRAVKPSYSRTLRHGTISDLPLNIKLVSKDEREFQVNGSCAPTRNASGSITGLVLAFCNVSADYELQRKLIEKQKMDAIGTLAGSVAQEFSNVLSVISGYASSIVESLIPTTRGHENALKICDAAEHGGQLASRLLSIARASDLASDVQITPVSLAKVLRSAIDLVKGTFDEKNIVFKTKALSGLPYVMVDQAHLMDALVNLFLNSAEAMPNGGIITIDSLARPIAKPANNLNPRAKAGVYVILRIRDDGTGMSKEVLDHCFDPFFSTKELSTSMGLGLTVIQGAVQKCGGWIKVRSRPGQGSSFRLFIPKAKDQKGISARKDRGFDARGKTILIVDDKKEARDKAAAILKDAGYKLHVAGNGEQAVYLYREHADTIDLSIIDVIMRGKDGKGVLDDILKIEPAALVIMTSGFSREYVRSYLERGSWGFIQKPYEAKQLLGVIERVLSQGTVHPRKNSTST